MVESNQLRGMAREPWAWWRSLGSPATVCAPMVDQSERAFRLLVRRHGCDLCYTPMLHADLVVRDAAYRRDHVPDDACAEDRPLIAQLGGGDPATLAAAARVWLRDQNIPGLAMSRSICDTVAKQAGCVSTPEILAVTQNSYGRPGVRFAKVCCSVAAPAAEGGAPRRCGRCGVGVRGSEIERRSRPRRRNYKFRLG